MSGDELGYAERLAAEKIVDPEVQRVTVYRENTNRHQRRKDAAEARKHGYGPNYRGEWK